MRWRHKNLIKTGRIVVILLLELSLAAKVAILIVLTRGPPDLEPDSVEEEERIERFIRIPPEIVFGTGSLLVSPARRAVLEGRNIHTGEDWTDWLIRHADMAILLWECPQDTSWKSP